MDLLRLAARTLLYPLSTAARESPAAQTPVEGGVRELDFTPPRPLVMHFRDTPLPLAAVPGPDPRQAYKINAGLLGQAARYATLSADAHNVRRFVDDLRSAAEIFNRLPVELPPDVEPLHLGPLADIRAAVVQWLHTHAYIEQDLRIAMYHACANLELEPALLHRIGSLDERRMHSRQAEPDPGLPTKSLLSVKGHVFPFLGNNPSRRLAPVSPWFRDQIVRIYMSITIDDPIGAFRANAPSTVYEPALKQLEYRPVYDGIVKGVKRGLDPAGLVRWAIQTGHSDDIVPSLDHIYNSDDNWWERPVLAHFARGLETNSHGCVTDVVHSPYPSAGARTYVAALMESDLSPQDKRDAIFEGHQGRYAGDHEGSNIQIAVETGQLGIAAGILLGYADANIPRAEKRAICPSSTFADGCKAVIKKMNNRPEWAAERKALKLALHRHDLMGGARLVRARHAGPRMACWDAKLRVERIDPDGWAICSAHNAIPGLQQVSTRDAGPLPPFLGPQRLNHLFRVHASELRVANMSRPVPHVLQKAVWKE